MNCEAEGCTAESDPHKPFDGCAICISYYCPKHMRGECCGNQPVLSLDDEEEDDDE